MRGYFSRLMEQTGMITGHGVDPAPKTIGQPQTDTIASIDLDLIRSVEPRENDAATPESSDSASRLLISSVDRLVERNLGGEASQVTDHSPERKKLHEQSKLPEGRELIVRDSDATSPQRDMSARESLEVEVMAETDAGRNSGEIIENVASQENERPASVDPTPGQTPTKPDRTEAWRGAVKEIREWVAETSTVNDAEVENRARREPESTKPDSPLVEREWFAASYPSRDTPTRHQEPETRDLHLAIGTISVTVEEPRREIEVSGSSDRTQKPTNAGNDERSRLGRHYIRTW